MKKLLLILSMVFGLNSAVLAAVDCEQSYKVQSFAQRFYVEVLGRTADHGGLDSWTNGLLLGDKTGADVANGFIFSQEFINQDKNNEEFITTLYKSILDREASADPDGLTYWRTQLDTNISKEDVVNGFLFSAEFANLSASYGIKAHDGASFASPALTSFVKRFYTVVLGREADVGGLAYWTERLNTGTGTGADIAFGFIFSAEYNEASRNNTEFLNTLYAAFFDRMPDTGGFTVWMTELSNGTSRQDVLNSFLHSQEFINLTSSFGILAFEGAPVVDNLDNIAPVAVAGADQSVFLGDNVTLDGSVSSDSDGTIECHWWATAYGQMTDTVSFTSSDMEAGVNPVYLTVVDNHGVSHSDPIVVTVDSQMDTDGDGIPNSIDTDDDNDGFSDIDEIAAGSDPLDMNSTPGVPVLEVLMVNMVNGSTSGAEVGTIALTSGNATSFTLSDDSMFSIDDNGLITINETLMCEGPSEYSLTVTANNLGGTSIPVNVIITVIAPTQTEWTLQDGTGTSDLIYGMSTDKFGNVLTAGYTKDSNSTFNLNVMKVSSSGTIIWSKDYDDDYYGVGYDTAEDSQGNIYVSGMTKGDFGDTNASCSATNDTTVSPFLLKLDKDGNELWGRLVCSDGAGLARDVIVDADDNAYLMGNVNGSLEDLPEVDKNDGFVVKFDSNGVRQFATQLATDENDFPGAIVAGTDGHVYVAGHTKGALGAANVGDYDVFVSKLDSNGTIVWTTQYGTSTTDKDVAIAMDDNGTLYITGKTKGSFEGSNQGSYDVFMTKMDSDGVILFTKVYGTAELDAGEDIVVAKNGNIFIGASVNINPTVGSTHSDIGILEISPNGTLYSFDINGTSTKDYTYGIAASKCGSVYVGGYTRGDLDGNTHSGGTNDRFIKHITAGSETNYTEPDSDGDDILDYLDPDDDNDGFSDLEEIAAGTDPLDANSVPNTAPVAVEDNVTVAEDSLATPIEVLLNDTDINDDNLSIASVTSPSAGGTAVAIFGKIIYTPLPNFSGIETFDYTVSDGMDDGNTVTVTVTVTASDDAPVAVDDNITVFVTSGTPSATQIDVLANDTDADGDTLNVTVVGPRSHGGSAIYIPIPIVKKILYTPAAGFTGTETFDYTISDGTSDSNATVTVEVVQMIVPALVSPIVEENLTNFTMVGEDWIVDTTTFESGPDSWASNIAGQDSTTTCMEKVIDSNGTLTFDYRTSTEYDYDFFRFFTASLEFEDSDVSGFWTASAHNITTAPLTVKWCYVKDSADADGDDTVWVDNIKMTSNNPFAYNIDENSSIGDVLGNIQIVANADAPIESFTVIGTGNADFAIDNNGEITVAETLDSSLQDTYELNVTATNAEGDSNTVSIVITVNLSNNAPVITSTAGPSATEAVEYTYDPVTTDAEGDDITWSLSNEPTGMTIDTNTGAITWTPTVGDTTSGAVILTATDDGIPNKSTTETFSITVLASGVMMHNGFVYEEVTSPETGEIWLDRNLGASQVCTSNDDANCHGGYYQWGRGHDGHQEINADTNSTKLTIGQVSDDFFESFGISGIEWLHAGEDDNGSLRISEWSSTDGSSVCPVGFSVPTVAQFMDETAVTDKDTGFSSFLKLPAAGFKHSSNYDGVEYAAPDNYYEGDYWTIEIAGGSQTTSSRSIYLDSSKVSQISFRAFGYSVRCIKN